MRCESTHVSPKRVMCGHRSVWCCRPMKLLAWLGMALVGGCDSESAPGSAPGPAPIPALAPSVEDPVRQVEVRLSVVTFVDGRLDACMDHRIVFERDAGFPATEVEGLPNRLVEAVRSRAPAADQRFATGTCAERLVGVRAVASCTWAEEAGDAAQAAITVDRTRGQMTLNHYREPHDVDTRICIESGGRWSVTPAP